MRRLSGACLDADVYVAEAVVALKKASDQSKHVKSNHVLAVARTKQIANEQTSMRSSDVNKRNDARLTLDGNTRKGKIM